MPQDRNEHRRELIDYYSQQVCPTGDLKYRLREFAGAVGVYPDKLIDFKLGVSSLSEEEFKSLDQALYDFDAARLQNEQDAEMRQREQMMRPHYERADELLSENRQWFERIVERGESGDPGQRKLREAVKQDIEKYGLSQADVYNNTNIKHLDAFLTGRANLDREEYLTLLRYAGEFELSKNRDRVAKALYQQSEQ